MREPYIVYAHIPELAEYIVQAYSPAHATYIIEQRMKKCGYKNCGVDGIMTIAKEKAIMSNRE